MSESTIRSSRADSARRSFGSLARATIQKANDKPKLQELDLNILGDDGDQVFGKETKTQVEYFGHYGFKSVPPAPSQGSNGVMQFAEALIAFLGGNRSHAVAIAVDDKRYRPTDWQPGESGHYDDQKQVAYLSRGGMRINGGTNNLPMEVQIGDAKHTFDKDYYEVDRGSAKFRVEDGKITHTVGGTTVTITDGRVDLGGLGGSPVMTQAGASTKVFAII